VHHRSVILSELAGLKIDMITGALSSTLAW
jgi:hypothetical protein